MSQPKIPLAALLFGLFALASCTVVGYIAFDNKRVARRYEEFTNRMVLRGTGGHITYASASYIEDGAYVIGTIDKSKENVFLNNKDNGGFPFKSGLVKYSDFIPLFQALFIGNWPLTKPVKRYGTIRIIDTDGSNYFIGFAMTSSDEGVDKTELHFFFWDDGNNNDFPH